MYVKDLAEIAPFHTPHGEVVRELGGQSAGGLAGHSVAHITVPSGKSSLKHYHPVVEESYYILAGAGQITIDGQTRRVSTGQLIAIAPQQVHEIVNDGQTDLVMLVVCAPPWTPDCSVFLDE